jgi:C4-dicarboxylate transporter DctM subunit
LTLLTLPIGSIIPLAQTSVAGIDAFTLIAIPLFLLMGNLMMDGGLTDRLMAFTRSLVGRFRGGLAMANVLAGLFFAGISGSAIADLVAIGSVVIPAMKKEGYSPGFSGAITSGAALLGPIIPPSILMILYGVQSGASITRLFLGGVIPGIMIAFLLLAYVYYLGRRRNFPVSTVSSIGEIVYTFRRAVPSLVTPVIIVLGVVYGIFTVTESASIAVVYAAILSLLVYRTVNIPTLWKLLHRTAADTAVIMLLIAFSAVAAWILAIERVPVKLVELVLSLGFDKHMTLLAINVILLLLGLFIEPAPGLILIVPVLIPLAQVYHIDFVHLGLIIVINLNLGLLTPPVALANMISARLAGISTKQQLPDVWPIFGIHFLVLMIITYVPWLVLALPNAVMN